jgi:hypothetical protein
MDFNDLSDREVARRIANALRTWRVDPRGAGITQVELARRSGVGLTPLKRFEKTGGITLNNLIALLRALGLLDRLGDLIPKPQTPSPMELLAADRASTPRMRAPRSERTTPASRLKERKRG